MQKIRLSAVVPALRRGLLAALLLVAGRAWGQSPHLRQQWALLEQQPAGSPGRVRALWHLAWESELPPERQDSLAALATAAGRRLGTPADTLPGAVWTARRLVYAGQMAPAEARLRALLPAARQLPDPWLRVQVLLLLARNHWGTATHARAETYLQQAWALVRRQPDPALRARVAWLLGTFYVDSGTALEWFFRSLPLAERAGDQALLVNILGSIGYHYQELRGLDQAQLYYERALALARGLHSPPILCRALVVSSGLLVARGELALARRQYREASTLATLRNTQFTIANNLATVYQLSSMPDSALHYARQARGLAQSLYDTYLNYSTLAHLFLETKQLDSARVYGQRAYAQHPPDTLQLAMRDLCEVLARTHAGLGEWRPAYVFQRRLQAYRDSLSSATMRARADVAQQRYTLEQLQLRDQELARLRRQRTLTLTAAAALLGLALTVGGVLLVRRRQARRLEALRTRLAADLHDDVGALLTQLAFDTAVLQGQPDTGADQQPRLARMATASQQAVRQLREVVWSIDSRHDSFASLLDRLRDYAHEVLPPAGVEVDFRAAPELYARQLAAPARQGLYLIYKEALHNLVKHARATEATIRLGAVGRALELTVDDDGPSAPPATLPRHHGLDNMARRARELGGHMAYEAAPGGTGWRVRLTLPLG
ncbi:histidine kinase [Hymenobacter sp. ASUV-10]|uniref:Histidine kinase n=1 Tax=Hymenobacter aranciens TaxID=3063996 RepID=A0ABT9BFZ1_9BACT|nr:ATP-binding protein [Hymenobacter sp. ASUV-10]MDO7877162.1 histidine kinase [Hymenobacter sp. ASUV-10]